MAKKTTTASAAKTTVASAKAEETKATTAKAVETKAAAKEVKEVKEVKETAAKAAEKKPAAKAAEKKTAAKTAEKKTAEKKTTEKKTTTKAALKTSMVLQVEGKDITEADLVAQIKKAWTSQFKGKIKDIKTMEIYVKPEENKAYFVINGEGNDNYFVEI